MRLLLSSALLLLGAFSSAAQVVVPLPLQPLGFLRGVWMSENDSGDGTTEFHWGVQDNRMVLAGRHWNNRLQTCPTCDTQSALVAYVDRASNEVYARFRDKTFGVSLFKLMLTGEQSADFQTFETQSSATYRLRYQLLENDILSVTLERESNSSGAFSIVRRWKLRRQQLIAPAHGSH